MAVGSLRELRPHVLLGLRVPVDHVECLIAALWYHGMIWVWIVDDGGEME